MNNRVKEIRKQKGIKQDEFARALGVSRQTVSSIETGRFDPSIMLAYKIAKIFELSIEEVFIFEDEQ
ncbi:MAG: helix-turn-helix transcriptional regulator [Ruminococcus sp.]|nr:helix-turn-helix transcriptional regulator [Ruminococcus sp.]